MSKIYSVVEFPLNKPFADMNRAEAEHYFQWFVSIIPGRIKILEEDVKTIVKDWTSDLTKESLLGLGKWIKAKASYRKVSEEERRLIIKREKISGLAAQLTMEMTETITDETKHRCFDLAIYFAETLRCNAENIVWDIEKRKSVINFNQPILVKKKDIPKGYVPLNPQPVAKTIANGMLTGNSEESVLKYYEKWYEIFTVGYQEPK